MTRPWRAASSALRRDVFDRLPGEGRWHTALLADGNVGIGGDPVALLRRAGELVCADGRVVVELGRPGVRAATRGGPCSTCAGVRSAPFRWATVGTDDIDELAAAAGLGRPRSTGSGSGGGARSWPTAPAA